MRILISINDNLMVAEVNEIYIDDIDGQIVASNEHNTYTCDNIYLKEKYLTDVRNIVKNGYIDWSSFDFSMY